MFIQDPASGDSARWAADLADDSPRAFPINFESGITSPALYLLPMDDFCRLLGFCLYMVEIAQRNRMLKEACLHLSVSRLVQNGVGR